MDYAFLNALFLAFVGGIILNCMPCVFPILSLKVLSILKQKNSTRVPAILDGLSYAAGVCISMFLLSVILLLLRATGNSLGWGFHMQSPALVSIMMHITFLIGLSFSGIFDIPAGISGMNSTFGSRNMGSFFAGSLSTLIGTPCAAPFMVSAISFALLQPWLCAIFIFQAMSIGIAFPYLIFSCIPKAANFLPKPGMWMEILKQFLAFPMYITSAWLLHILAAQQGYSVVFPAVCSLIVLVMLIVGMKFVPNETKFAKIVFVTAVCSISIASSLYVGKFHAANSQRVDVIAFSQDKLQELLDRKENVFVAVGAEWCLTCKTNEVVISSGSIQNIFSAHNVIYMKADWTSMDEKIANYLSSFGSTSIPFYVLYVKGTPLGKDLIPQIFTADKLAEILERSLR
ncbi:protein-disulfide reductase DsbD family protein [Anaplasma bovis]|uniref:protein-disulfide reductase DsbD family protein n=1 Tax=Anaplasma bovis TaxID=186733 RepID=UPI002FEF237C